MLFTLAWIADRFVIALTLDRLLDIVGRIRIGLIALGRRRRMRRGRIHDHRNWLAIMARTDTGAPSSQTQ
jgi:hypothetical protein